MGFADFLIGDSLIKALLVILVLLLLNGGIGLVALYLVKRKYNREQSVEKALYDISLVTKFLVFPLLFITCGVSVVVIMSLVEREGIIPFMLPFAIAIVIALATGFIYMRIFHHFSQKLRNTTVSIKNETKDYFRTIFIMITPFGGALLLSFSIGWIMTPFELENDLRGILRLAPFFVLPFLSPYTFKFLTKSKPMIEGELFETLNKYLKDNNIGKTTLYVWKTRDRKIANAMVTGFNKKQIFISDYLTDSLTTDEILSILAHEIAHIKGKHILKRMLFFIPAIAWPLGLGFLFEVYENRYSEINLMLGFGVMVIPVIIYLTFGMYYIYKKQEEQADKMAIESGINPRVYISALLKLAKLNNTVSKFNKLDEALKTHPSYIKRIKNIVEVSGIEGFDSSII